MALQQHHLQSLKKRWDAMLPSFDGEIWTLLRGYARQTFGPTDPAHPDRYGHLPRDVLRLRGDRWPITEGDLVIGRSRWLWLLTDRIRTSQTLQASWTANETLRALEHVDLTRGAQHGCDRPEAQLRLFDALVEDYATQSAQHLRDLLTSWLERQTADTLRAIQASPADFAAVRSNLAAYANQEVWILLTGKADREILTSPSQLRNEA